MDTFRIKYPAVSSIHYAMDREAKYNLYTDPVLLGSVFQNLIENAYKYSHHAPIKSLFINITHRKTGYCIYVYRQGYRDPKKRDSKIYSRNFIVLENQYNQNGSVGLGLAFCKELANFMDGDISC
jgi:two-component system phosphate regulon sensor histidine kinase PhoR